MYGDFEHLEKKLKSFDDTLKSSPIMKMYKISMLLNIAFVL